MKITACLHPSAFLAPIVLSIALASFAPKASAQRIEVPATSSEAFTYICVRKAIDQESKTVRFDRIIDMPGKGYEWDNPGARICFRTDAREISANLFYSARHISKTARNGKGLYLIDGKTNPAWTFSSQTNSIARAEENLSVPLTVPSEAGFHNYEIVLPYGDSVEFRGLSVDQGARFEPFPVGRKVRYVAFGDSVTQGFTSSQVAFSYPFLLAENKQWNLLNMGFGGRSTNAGDGKIVADLNPDIVSILIGVNDWQGGVPVEKTRAQMEGLLRNIRQKLPHTPLCVITPLWVNSSWKPKTEVASLDTYRQAIRDVVKMMNDPKIQLIEGPSLIEADPKYFDKVPVHPNNAGFAMMTERLARQIQFPR